MFILILSLAFALFVAVFALQNSAPVPIYIFWTTQEVPLVLVILGSALSGAIIVFLLALWREFRYRRKKALEAKTKALEAKANETKTPQTHVEGHDISEEHTETDNIIKGPVNLEDNES